MVAGLIAGARARGYKAFLLLASVYRGLSPLLLPEEKSACVFLSVISLLEVARLVAYGRIDRGTTVNSCVDEATRNGGFQLLPLSTRVLIESTRLPGDLHRDPSDRLLAATARERGLTLVHRDGELPKYGRKGHVRTLKV